MPTELEILEDALKQSDATVQRGMNERLSATEITQILTRMLFEITNNLPNNELVEVRDYGQIAERGTSKYAGQSYTMLKEGLMPEDVYDGLRALDIKNHIGPSYLRVKGLLTHLPTRQFFGRQMAFLIRDYLTEKPLSKPDGFVLCIPNMTGGVWIGDETARQLATILTEYKVWPVTPYAREMRKSIDVISPGERLVDYVEGLMPSHEQTAVIFPFEELRTATETTQNATNVYRGFRYNEQNGVRITVASVFDYRHPVGVERIARLGVDALYLVDGRTFFATARDLGYISDSQYRTAMDWLGDPWGFTRKVLPDLVKLARK